jgi:hypothetical protein
LPTRVKKPVDLNRYSAAYNFKTETKEQKRIQNKRCDG